VREARILVAAEIALQDAAVIGAIEDRTPHLELPDAVRRFSGVKLGHAPVVEILSAAHRVGEMDFPVVTVVDVGERCRHSALGHHRVSLAEKRFADETNRSTGLSRFDRRAQSRAAGADHEHIVLVSLVLRHSRKASRRARHPSNRGARTDP
jgi:hypothetical protein